VVIYYENILNIIILNTTTLVVYSSSLSNIPKIFSLVTFRQRELFPDSF